jgi:putative transposase
MDRSWADLFRKHILNELPVVVNDRGSQMKAKEVKQMFQVMGLTQTFSRPRTPNDNPFVESLF